MKKSPFINAFSFLLLFVAIPPFFSCSHTYHGIVHINVENYTVIDETGLLNINIIDKIILGTSSIFGMEKSLNGLTIIFTEEELRCGSFTSAYGCYKCNSDTIYVLAHNGTKRCLADSALVHELFHYLLEKTMGTCDPFHRFTGVWENGGMVHRLMGHFAQKLCEVNNDNF